MTASNFMNDKFKPLDRDDDVLLFDNNNTFTVAKFKEVVSKEFTEIFLNIYPWKVRGGTSEERADIKSDINKISFDSERYMWNNEIHWEGKGVSCKLLKVGFGGWQEGTVRVQARIVNSYYENYDAQKYKKAVIDICIEFCPDQPTEPISPLDDIRQSEEYKKLSDNK
ncbi:KGK domain-containing protein [Microcoleus sp. LAD1_D5]|uniref:KGK domain-containing protein n=2 Tax=unclassified Microcoleus TaxID=2642155 RepID=UPI002FD49606